MREPFFRVESVLNSTQLTHIYGHKDFQNVQLTRDGGSRYRVRTYLIPTYIPNLHSVPVYEFPNLHSVSLSTKK